MKTANEVRRTLKENGIKGVNVRSGTGSVAGQVIVSVTSKCFFSVEDVKNALGYKNLLELNLFIQ